MRSIGRKTLLTLGSLLGIYLLLWLATCGGRGNVAVDYLQLMQELQPVGPEEERSWPLIREANKRVNEERLALLRTAAGRRRIGFKIHPEMEEAELAIWPPPASAESGLLGQAVLQVRLPFLIGFGSACQDLAADMTAAAARGDGQRAAADAEAIIGLSRQLATPGSTLIQQLVGWSNLNLAATQVAQVLTAHPEAFTDGDLSRLAEALRSLESSAFHFDLAVERFMIADIVQRLYTDDGDGDGSLTLEGSIALRTGSVGEIGLSGSLPRWAAIAAAPLHLIVVASRRELVERWNDYMDRLQSEADREPWVRDADTAFLLDIEVNRASELERFRYELFFSLTPAFGPAMSAAARTEAMTGAARLVVAAEQFRRAMGRWPQSSAELTDLLGGDLPVDPWTGEPLRVGQVDESLRVWSLCEDRTDEGGRPMLDPYGSQRPAVGPGYAGFFHEGAAAEGPAPEPELQQGWLLIPNWLGTSPLRGDWVLWPHSPPVTSPSPANPAADPAPAP